MTLVRYGAACAVVAATALAGCTFNIVLPADKSTVPSPVAADIKWDPSLQSNTLKIVLDPNGSSTDVTSQFSVGSNRATASLPMPPGNHRLAVSGNLWDGLSQAYAFRSVTSDFSVFNGPENLSCFVFDDGYTNLAGPSDAIFITGRTANGDQGKACIPDGTANGTCRKWFGRCVTASTAKPVYFNVFDDGSTNLRGPSDAVFIPPAGGKACIPDGTTAGTCRKWFGEAFSADGRAVDCTVFGDGYTSPAGPSGAIVIPNPIPNVGAACVPDGTITGTCRKWFGRCSTVTGTPITYTEVITGTPGWPSGTINGVAFGGGTADIKLTLTFESNTANVVAYFVPTTKHAVQPGSGFENTVGTASFKIEDMTAGTVIAQGTFLPSAGIFVSVDNGNAGIGFGSFGAIPPDPNFPVGGMEVAYPYARFLVGRTDLRSNYTSGASRDAISCVGFNGSPGSPGPAGSSCNAPKPLATTVGPLLINSDVPVNPTPLATFSAVLH